MVAAVGRFDWQDGARASLLVVIFERGLKQFVGALAGLGEEHFVVLELGMVHVHFKEQVAGVVKSVEYFAEAIPVDRSLIGQRVGVGSLVVVDVNGQEPIGELLEQIETCALDVLVT